MILVSCMKAEFLSSFVPFFRFFFKEEGVTLWKADLNKLEGVCLKWTKVDKGGKKGSILSKDCLTSIVNSQLNIPALVIWQDLSENTLNKCSGKTKLAWIQIDISCSLFYVISLSNQHFTRGNMLFVYLGLRIKDLILF